METNFSVTREILDLSQLTGASRDSIRYFSRYAFKEVIAPAGLTVVMPFVVPSGHCAVVRRLQLESYPVVAGEALPALRQFASFIDIAAVAWKQNNQFLTDAAGEDYHKYVGELFFALSAGPAQLIFRFTQDGRTRVDGSVVDSQLTYFRLEGFTLPIAVLSKLNSAVELV